MKEIIKKMRKKIERKIVTHPIFVGFQGDMACASMKDLIAFLEGTEGLKTAEIISTLKKIEENAQARKKNDETHQF